jgi:hypothetical protein
MGGDARQPFRIRPFTAAREVHGAG